MQELLPGQAQEPAREPEEDALSRLRVALADPPLPFALAASALGGVLLSIAFPPVGFWPAAFVAPMPLYWAIRLARPRRGFVLGTAFGAVGYGLTIYWILLFGEMAWGALTLLMALSVGLFGLVLPIVRRHGAPTRNAVGAAALWTLIDHMRGVWPLGGFTWGSLGISQVDNPVSVRIAVLAGGAAVTFGVVLVAFLLVEAAVGGGGKGRRWALAISAIAIALLPGLVPFATPEGSVLDVATLQVDVRVPPGTSAGEADRIIAARHVELMSRLGGEPAPDLVLWGEGALDPAASADPALMEAVGASIASVGVPAVLGAVVDDPDGSQHTSALVFDGEGIQVDRYDKVHLVPFGEYVPFRRRLGFIEALEQIPVDRVPGERVRSIQVGTVPAFGTPICFENSFPQLIRDFVREGATFLVVPVNNASYRFTAASDQHLQMSRLRAIETGRWIVDAAISGVSAFVGPDGRVVSRTELFEESILRGQITTSSELTPSVRLGDTFVWLLALTTIGLALAPPRVGVDPLAAPDPLPAEQRTLVVLPTFDEARSIERVVSGLLARPERLDLLVIDDSSPDGTGELVRAMAQREARVRLVSRPSRSGLASAYTTGFRMALDEGYDLVVEMDSDLSHDPEELGLLLSAASRHDLTIGSRYVPGGSVTNWSRFRLALSRGGNRYARLMLGLPIHDATSGYRVYRRGLLSDLMIDPLLSEGYGFQIEMALRAHLQGRSIGEVPITFREREHGVSKISRAIVVEAMWHVTRWGFSLRLGSRFPDRVSA